MIEMVMKALPVNLSPTADKDQQEAVKTAWFTSQVPQS